MDRLLCPTMRRLCATIACSFFIGLITQIDWCLRKYYQYGWERLKETPLAGMRLDAISSDVVSLVPFSGSAAWGNQARRTLRAMLGEAVRDGLVRHAPQIHLADETGRDGILDDQTEAQLLKVAAQPLKDVLIIIRDTGLRPAEVFRIFV